MSNHCERWLSVPGYEGLYEVSSAGRVKSLKSGRWRSGVKFLSWHYDRSRYPKVSLYRNGLGAKYRVHSLVALAFLGPRPTGMQVRHIDGDRNNPKLDNLGYCTQKENEADKLVHGTRRRGSMCSNAKLHENDIPEIRRRISEGHKIKDIALDYGVLAQRITDIRRGRTWRHV